MLRLRNSIDSILFKNSKTCKTEVVTRLKKKEHQMKIFTSYYAPILDMFFSYMLLQLQCTEVLNPHH